MKWQIFGLQTDTHIHIQMTESDALHSGITKGPRRQSTAEPICSVGENYTTSPKRVLNVNYFIMSYCLVNLNSRFFFFLHEIR